MIFSATPNPSRNPFGRMHWIAGGTGSPEGQYGSLQAGGQSQSPVTIRPEPEVDYSYYFSPAHRALRAAEARKIGERAGEPIIPPGFEGFVKSDLFDISRLPKVPTYEKVMAEYDAERADLPPVSGPFPTIRNEYFRMQPGVYNWETGEREDQLQYLDPQLPTVLNGYSRGTWQKADDSPAIRRLASTPNLFTKRARGGRGPEHTYWKRAINEALANPNKGPGPLQQTLGMVGRVHAQNLPLLERPSSKGIFGIPAGIAGIGQAALMGLGAGHIAGTVAAGVPQTALTALNAANIAATTATTDLSNPNTNIGPLATLGSAFLPGGKFIAPVVGAGTGYVSGGAKGAVFGGLRGLGAAYTAGELAAPSPTPPSLFLPSTQGVYSGLGPAGTVANLLGSPGGQFLTSIGESLTTPVPAPQTIGALAPAALSAIPTAVAARTIPVSSGVPSALPERATLSDIRVPSTRGGLATLSDVQVPSKYGFIAPPGLDPMFAHEGGPVVDIGQAFPLKDFLPPDIAAKFMKYEGGSKSYSDSSGEGVEIAYDRQEGTGREPQSRVHVTKQIPIPEFLRRHLGLTGDAFADYSSGTEKFDPEGMLFYQSEFNEGGEVLPPDLQELQETEHGYYAEHPPDTLVLTPTGENTQYELPIYKDQHGMLHSESTGTFQVPNGKWITISTIYPDPETGEARYFDQEEILERIILPQLRISDVIRNPVNGEVLPLFDTEPEATRHALERDQSLQRDFQGGGEVTGIGGYFPRNAEGYFQSPLMA